LANSSSHGSPDLSSATVHSLSAKRKLTAEEIEREKDKKKKKSEKWTETMNAKTQVTVQKKNAWETFGKKAAKKGVKIGG
jgi:survival-of-motor-neuron-related-splicing factor 30